MNRDGSVYSSSAAYKWYVVGMLWWISFFNYADRQAIFSVFPKLQEEMSLTQTEKGLLGSAFAWVYGLAAPFAGLVVDRIARKTAILGGLHIWSLICMATALSRNFRQLFFFRAAEGLGETFYYPAANSLVSDYHGKSTRSRALGLHQTSVYVGTIAGGYFAGWIGLQHGWRMSFIVFGGCGIILGLVLHYFLREPPRGAAEDVPSGATTPTLTVPQTLALLASRPTVLLLMAAFMCSNYVAMVLLAWMPDYLNSNFGLRLDLAGLGATAPPQLASLAGAILGGWLADALRKRTPRGRIIVQAGAVLLGANFVFLCGQTQQIGWLFFALIFWGLFKGFYDANIFASVFDVVPAHARGTIAGLMNMFGWLCGGASAPLITGLLADEYGLGKAISAAAGVYIMAGVFLLTAGLFVSRDLAKLANLGSAVPRKV